MPATTNPQLQVLVSEDCRDLLAYLSSENISGADRVLALVERPSGLAALENVVLQVARAYAICAFEQNTDLEILTPRIQASLEKYPDLLAVVRIYQGHIDLAVLNEVLDADAHTFQAERLADYLGQFLPERLA